MQTAFVTGASGFIGSALVHRLLNDGYTVRAMCRSIQKGTTLSAAGAEVVIGDVQNPYSLNRLMTECDVVFHVAAVGSGSASYQYNINVQGSRNVIKAAHEVGAQRFVHVSSVAVYGYNVSGDITEDFPQKPPYRDFYMKTKAMGEQAVWKYATRTNFPTVSIRPAFVYGPGSLFWSKQMYKICQHYPTPLIEGGIGNAHPIYIDDVVDLLITAATHPAAPGHAFNAAPDPAPTWAEYLNYYAKMVGQTASLPISLPPKSILKPIANSLSLLARLAGSPYDIYGMTKYIAQHTTYKMTRAATMLDWHPKFTLEQGMAQTQQWLITEPTTLIG